MTRNFGIPTRRQPEHTPVRDCVCFAFALAGFVAAIWVWSLT